MNKNETTLPVQGNALARVQTWLSLESEFFTALLEHPVTNGQALRKKSAASLGRFAENRHLCSVKHFKVEAVKSANSSLRAFFMPKTSHIGSVPCAKVNASAASTKVFDNGERNLFCFPNVKTIKSNIMVNKLESLPVQGNALARVQTWLSLESEFFTALLEHPVTNGQALRKKSAASLGRFAENRHLCSALHFIDRGGEVRQKFAADIFYDQSRPYRFRPVYEVNARTASIQGVEQRGAEPFLFPEHITYKLYVMNQNETTLPVQGNALARVQTWLSRESEFFTALLEQPVTNGQALRLSHATVAGFAVPLAAAVSPMTAVLTLAWWVCTLMLCRKGGAR